MPHRYQNEQVRTRIGEAIRLRRANLNLTQEQLAERAGLSLRTVQNTEAGANVIRPVTRGRLEVALEWEPGTLSKMYDELGTQADPSVTAYAPAVRDLLEHPALSPEARKVILAQLEMLHEKFAQEMSRAFRLSESENHLSD